MKKKLAVLISLLFVASTFGVATIFGVQYTSFGANTYKVYDEAYKWIEIADTGTGISYTGDATTGWRDKDDGHTIIPIGFDFPFYGKNYSTIYLSTNGHIDFVEGTGYSGRNRYGYKIPTESRSSASPDNYWGENPLIAFLFYDLDFTYAGSAYYQNFGDYFVIEFDGVGMYKDEEIITTPGTHSVQVILYKNGNIKIQYKTLTYAFDHYGNTPIVGLDLDDVTGVSYDGEVKEGMALLFTNRNKKSLPMDKILKILKANKDKE